MLEDYEDNTIKKHFNNKIIIIVSVLIIGGLLYYLYHDNGKNEIIMNEEVYVYSFLSPNDMTNGKVKINMNIVGENYKYTILPNNNGEITLYNYTYEVEENGRYIFRIVYKSGETKFYEVEVSNIDKTNALGSCMATKYKDYTDIEINMYNKDNIAGYSFVVDEDESKYQIDNHYIGNKDASNIYVKVKYDNGVDEKIECEIESMKSSIDEYGIKKVLKGEALHIPIADALFKNGYTINDLNKCIYDRVVDAKPGTREGVVAAAFGLLDCTYDMTGGYTLSYNHTSGNIEEEYRNGVKITNYQGLNKDIYDKLGINSIWGKAGGSCRKEPCYHGLNCASFVRWSLCNGGMNFCDRGSNGAGSLASTKYFPLADSVTIHGNSITKHFGNDLTSISVDDLLHMIKIGDIVYSDDGKTDDSQHVVMVIGKDDEGIYIAENGRNTRYLRFSVMTNGENNYRILYLDRFYADASNKNNLYN